MKIWHLAMFEIVVFICLLILMYSAISSLITYQNFVAQVSRSPFINDFPKLKNWIGWIIPTSEISIALFLVMPRFRYIGLWATLGLMVVFTSYIVAVINFATYLPCTCIGILSKWGWIENLTFNLSLATLTLIGIVLHQIGLKKSRKFLQ